MNKNKLYFDIVSFKERVTRFKANTTSYTVSKTTILLFLLNTVLFNIAYSQTGLQYYIENAEQNSPLLHKQTNNNKIIDIDLKQFDAIYKSAKLNLVSNVIFSPILSKDGNTNKLEWASSGSNDYIGYDLGATNGGQYQALISVSQPLFAGKYYSVQENNASIAKERNANAVHLTKANLKQLVTHQYILCIQAQKQKENIQNTIQIIKEQIQQMKTLVNAGVYKLTDLKLLEITLESSEIKNEQLNGEYLNNFNTLKLLCGISDTTLYNLEDINLQLNTQQQTPSLFLLQFKLDSLSVDARKKIFNTQYLPQIDVFGDAGLNATYQPSPNRLGFSVGISLKWNLFDGHQKQLIEDKSQIQLSNIEIDKKYFENQNNIRKNNILRQINNLNKQLSLINKQLIEYNKLLELYQIEIKKGLVSVLELKTLIKEITIKKQNKTNTLMMKEILINMYNYWNQ